MSNIYLLFLISGSPNLSTMTLRHDSYWFVPKWIGQIVHFENPSSSWKIIQKLQEREHRFIQDEYVSSGFYSESTAIFICEAIEDSKQAIMKVRIQILNGFDDKPLYPMCSQTPEKKICGRTDLEIKALEALTSAGCSCTPKYIISKHENQVSDSWVPDGFLDYIVMEKIEGISLSRKYLRRLSPKEQGEIRKAFKASYQ
ncbi:uncharacterized protein KD926_006173 [Aspergillus affinis]|uniref:uncharacterized protein n=1 Tax=Aspergillus affinis TaxID=1070780 RepID=UPI0022FDBE04|nr:uncharacterized protein KD926_006173 [Aspergillus affinis]KAI9042049.1 hypothetical protein KD926_006173 [Aspergillus affinis]